MKSALVIAHGSRKDSTNDMFFEILEMVKEMSPDTHVEGAFISFSDIDIESSLEKLVNMGSTEIDIIPYLLFAGDHFNSTIPEKTEQFMKNHKDVKVNYKKSLGVDRRLAEILVDRIND